MYNMVMSNVTRQGRVDTEYQAAYLEGDAGLRFETEDLNKFAWRCDGCGLVWTRKHQAENCESREHATSYDDQYFSNQNYYDGPDGRRVYIPTVYTRRPIRRDDADDLSYDAWTTTQPAKSERKSVVSRMGAGAQRLRSRSQGAR